MRGYFIAQIKIHDFEEYKKYLEGTDAVLKKYKGDVLVVDENPVILEGEWFYSRVVIIRFPSVEAAEKWYHSPEYREIVRYRHNASKADAIIVKGR
ncbi:MAG: DUF1330 domain-containing protein [Promethearchaeota archaeon]